MLCPGTRRAVLTEKLHGVVRLRLGHTPEADDALSLQRDRVPPHEGVVAALGLHESTIGALVDEPEPVLAGLDPRGEPRGAVRPDREALLLAASSGRRGAPARCRTGAAPRV